MRLEQAPLSPSRCLIPYPLGRGEDKSVIPSASRGISSLATNYVHAGRTCGQHSGNSLPNPSPYTYPLAGEGKRKNEKKGKDKGRDVRLQASSALQN